MDSKIMWPHPFLHQTFRIQSARIEKESS